jgi:hypothetical protein
LPYDQVTDLPTGGSYRAQVVENAFDRTEMQIQQLAEAIARALVLSPAVDPADVSTQLPAPVAFNVIGWNGGGPFALQNFDPSTFATIVAFGTSQVDLFSGDGVETEFVLTANPGVLGNLDVAVDGVTQRPGVDFTWSGGTTLTFIDPPAVGTDNVLARYMQGLPQGYTDSDASTFLQFGAGAQQRSVQSKLREWVSVTDFGASPANTRAQNDTAFTAALNSGARTVFVPNSYPNKYLLSARLVIAAAAQGIALVGEDKQNTVLSWQVDGPTVDKFALLLDAFVTVENFTIENTGTDLTNSGGLVSSTPTVGNGMRNGVFRNIRLAGWGVGVGASSDGLALTLARSQCFSNLFENIEFYGCSRPISLGAGANNNVWVRPAFVNNKGDRHIHLVEGSSNLFISPQFEPVDASVAVGMLNAELVLSPNNTFLNPYLEPCYGFLADASPGTVIDGPIIEGFDFTVGTLSSSAILRSTDASNGGVYAAPMLNQVRLPVSRASVNPVSYCASDDTANTITLVDGFTSRDANFNLKPAGQFSKLSINTQGTFTPTITGSGGGGAGNTYSSQAGQWIRNGNAVTAWFRVALTAKDGALAGNAQISGLPFNIANLLFYGPAATLSEFLVDLTAGYTQLLGEGTTNTTTISLVQGGDNVSPISLPVAGITATTVFIGQITYITDAT